MFALSPINIYCFYSRKNRIKVNGEKRHSLIALLPQSSYIEKYIIDHIVHTYFGVGHRRRTKPPLSLRGIFGSREAQTYTRNTAGYLCKSACDIGSQVGWYG